VEVAPLAIQYGTVISGFHLIAGGNKVVNPLLPGSEKTKFSFISIIHAYILHKH
jgi:hypothetical protein